ncbi:hypothetical protein D3C80_1996870 [compost metagenome]
MFGQLVDDFDARQLGRQRLALAATLDRRNDFFLGLIGRGFRRCFGQAFGLVEYL